MRSRQRVPLRRYLLTGLGALGLMASSPFGVGPARAAEGEVSQARYSVARDLNVAVTMRDGVRLSADVYRPDSAGRFPVILIRTPYLKATERYAQRGAWWAARGYVFVVQDVRGRGDSDGAFYPLKYEAEDGYDSQTWAGVQPWSSGKVGTMGGSYLGWTQLYPAGLNNPYLQAMAPAVTAPDPLRNTPWQHGALLLAALPWAAGVDGRVRQDLSQIDMLAAYRTRPLTAMDRAVGRSLPVWQDWIGQPFDSPYWDKLSYQKRLLASTAPALHITGWYDDVQVGTLENFAALTGPGRPEALRRNQRLVVGPWGHATNASQKLGEIDHGPTALIDLDGLHLRWFDRWLKGIDNGVDQDLPVRVFLMGANEWRSEAEWPIARTRYTRMYLRSTGRANGSAGDGRLDLRPPANDPPDRYRYDPKDPTPFITELTGRQVGGPDDYSNIERRNDVLVYTSPVVKEAYDICGPLKVRLWAASSARDTDWTAKLLDVHPNGFAQRLNDGIVRARFRNGLSRPELLKPGVAQPYDIDLWATCMRMRPGHRLRLEIASSAFPKFDRNPNTGGEIGRETETVTADQTVFHDRTRASYVLLPIVPPKRGKP